MYKDNFKNKDLAYFSEENTFLASSEKFEITVLDIEGAVDSWISYDNEADYLHDLELLGIKEERS